MNNFEDRDHVARDRRESDILRSDIYQHRHVKLCLAAVSLVLLALFSVLSSSAEAQQQYAKTTGTSTFQTLSEPDIAEVQMHEAAAPDPHSGHQGMTDEEKAGMSGSGSESGSESGPGTETQKDAADQQQSWIPYANAISIMLVAMFLLFRGKRQLGTRSGTDEAVRDEG